VAFNASYGRTTVPWDKTFQGQWEKLNKALAARYDGRLAYVKLIGAGHASESHLATKPEDQSAAEALAKASGYSDLATAWKEGVKWLIDMYARVWIHTPFVLGTGPPFRNGGIDALRAMFDYGDATYRGRFGARADDLTSNSPQDGQPSAEIIKTISQHCRATGYQFGNHQNVKDSNPPTRLGQALERGIGFGAHFEELFADDADDTVSAPVLSDAMKRLIGTVGRVTPVQKSDMRDADNASSAEGYLTVPTNLQCLAYSANR